MAAAGASAATAFAPRVSMSTSEILDPPPLARSGRFQASLSGPVERPAARPTHRPTARAPGTWPRRGASSPCSPSASVAARRTCGERCPRCCPWWAACRWSQVVRCVGARARGGRASASPPKFSPILVLVRIWTVAGNVHGILQRGVDRGARRRLTVHSGARRHRGCRPSGGLAAPLLRWPSVPTLGESAQRAPVISCA